MAEAASQDIISEETFAGVLSDRVADFASVLNLLLTTDATRWKKRHYVELAGRAQDLETLLDDHEARNNRAFAYPTELVASLRGFANVGTTLMHLTARFPRYNVALDPSIAGKFFEETERTVRFLQASVLRIAKDLRRSLDERSVQWTDEIVPDASVAEDPHQPSLPNNIDEEDLLNEERKIAEVATLYLGVVEQLEGIGEKPIDDSASLKSLVIERVDEERCRHIETLVHSLQSKYDTYVRSTAIESQTPSLARMRGHVSLALHLFEMATELVHFYVRHENDIRYEAAKQSVAALIDKTEVLDRAVNYALLFGCQVLRQGSGFATEALSQFVTATELVVAIPAGTSLHARPISLIVKIVNHHSTRVEMRIGNEACNAGSIMEIIMIAGNHPEIDKVEFHGDARTLDDLRVLFDHGLGELGAGELPDALDYLR